MKRKRYISVPNLKKRILGKLMSIKQRKTSVDTLLGSNIVISRDLKSLKNHFNEYYNILKGSIRFTVHIQDGEIILIENIRCKECFKYSAPELVGDAVLQRILYTEFAKDNVKGNSESYYNARRILPSKSLGDIIKLKIDKLKPGTKRGKKRISVSVRTYIAVHSNIL